MILFAVQTPTETDAAEAAPSPLAIVQETAQDFSGDAASWISEDLVTVAIVVAAVLAVFAALVGARLLLPRLIRAPEGERLSWASLPERLAGGTLTLFLFVAAAFAVVPAFGPPAGVVTGLRFAFTVLAVLQGALWLREIVMTFIVAEAQRRSPDESALANATGVLKWIVNLVLWSVALLLILDNLGVDVTALVAGLGIGGIAVGLAAQGIMSDLFSALSIVFDRPFVRGDFIVFGEAMGEVEQIGLKTTRIRALSGEQIVVANSELLSQLIHNYRRMQERRVAFSLRIAHDTPADIVAAIPGMLQEAVIMAGPVRFDRAHFTGVGDMALEFEVVYFVLSRDFNTYRDVHQSILIAILRRFASDGIRIAFPYQALRLVQEDVPGSAAYAPASAAPIESGSKS